MSKLDPRLLHQLQQLRGENQSLQGQVSFLEGQSNVQEGGFRSRLRTRMKNVFGGMRNPRIGNSKISPLPAGFRGKHLF